MARKVSYIKRFAAVFLVIALAAANTTALAQEAGAVGVFHLEAPQFFFAIIAGLILALAFQSVLTFLSISVGLTMTPSMRPGIEDARAHAREHQRKAESLSGDNREPQNLGAAASPYAAYYPEGTMGDESGKTGGGGETGKALLKFLNGMGIWLLVTTSIALFFAAWLAVELSLVPTVALGVILGLIIWAAFFALVSYLEAIGISSLLGGMVHLGTSGITGSFDLIKNVVSSSREKEIEKTARNVVHAIYEEVSQIAHHDKLDKRIAEYLRNFQAGGLDYDKVRKDILDLLEHLRLEEHIEIDESDLSRIFTMHIEKSALSRENAGKLSRTVKDAMRDYKSKGTKAEGAIAAMEKLAPVHDEDAHAFRMKLEKWLAQTGREEIRPDAIYDDLEKMLQSPKATPEIISHRLSLINRDTIRDILVNNLNISSEKAQKTIDMLLGVKSKMSEKYRAGETGDGGGGGSMQETVERRISEYFQSLGLEELDYETLKTDVQEMLHDPKHAPDILRHRLSQMDRETVITVLASNPNISEERAQKITDTVLEARDETVRRISKLEEEALLRYEKTRQHALEAAENARKSAIAASWWTFGAAVTSGLAAAIGGWIAVVT